MSIGDLSNGGVFTDSTDVAVDVLSAWVCAFDASAKNRNAIAKEDFFIKEIRIAKINTGFFSNAFNY